VKAVVYDEYGSPGNLELREIPDPVCGPADCLVRVRAAAVNPADWRVLAGRWRWITGRRFPRKIGIDFAGTITETGPEVTRFKPGDEVMGSVSYLHNGTFAEYVAAAESGICRRPSNLSVAECAGIPVVTTTAHLGLTHRFSDVAARKILVTGSGGGVGHMAVQLAKILGSEVTAVCSTAKVELSRSLGAGRVIDYTQYSGAEDVVRELARFGSFDIVFDCARSLPPKAARRLLAPKGESMLLSTEGKIWKLLAANLTQLLPGRRTWALLAHPDGRRLEGLVPLFEEGRLRVVTSSRYPLEKAADALRESMGGHATGKIIVEV